MAVAGTHGKTTTTSLLAWILEYAGLAPGFLIGGVPANFNSSARLGAVPFFVIEADEYDTAFFDKRAKFVHYHPRTLVLNNLEFDHADIYPDVAAIQRQFHHLVRTVPGSGSIIWNAGDERLAQTLKMGCWTPLQGFSGAASGPGLQARWRAGPGSAADFSRFDVLESGTVRGTVEWDADGRAQHGERAGGDRGRAPCRGSGGHRHRGAARLQRYCAAHAAARGSARHAGLR